MKEKTKKRIKGSVSIFLVIIMVPMICLSGLIVDGSRAELAKSAISSAGDLTMNSALANYDTVLKDVYGLFAMSQTSSDLENNLYDYFVNTLMANGIVSTEDEIKSNPLLQDIAGAFSGQTSNMLSMEVDKSTFNANGLKDSTLANTDILKNQIVEYEKYRAPVGAALSLLDGIASLKKILNQSSVNKAKTKVDEKSKELNEESDKLYDALKKYDSASGDVDQEFETFYISGYNNADVAYAYGLSNPSRYKPAFEKVLSGYVRAIAETMPFDACMTKNSDGTYKLDGLSISKKGEDKWVVSSFGTSLDILYGLAGSFKGKKWTNSTTATNEELLEQLKEAYIAINNGYIQDTLSDIIYITDISKESLNVRREYSFGYKTYLNKVRDLKVFYDLYKAQSGEETVTFTTQINYESVTVTDSDITDIMENAVTLSKRVKAYEQEFQKSTQFANHVIEELSAAVAADLKWFDDNDIDGILDKAIKKLGDVENKIGEVNTANGSLKTQINEYNGSDPSDSFSKQMEQDYEYYKDTIDPGKVAALKTKLTDLRQYFKDVKAYLEGIKFVGVKVTKLTTLTNMVTETKNKKTSTGESVTDYINNHISNDTTPIVDFLKTQYTEEKTCPAKINISIADDEFWLYLQQAFGVEGDDEDHAQEDLKNEMKDDAAKADDAVSSAAAFNNVTVSEDIKKLLPSQGSFTPPKEPDFYDGNDDNFSSLFDSITKAVDDLVQGIKKAATAGRDNLYVSEYVFDMFSYNTMEAEFKFELKESESSDVDKDLAEKLKTSSGVTKSSKNNYMYGAEIEYILHGQFDSAKNIKNVKQTIFCIRFLANTGYALTNTEIKSITLPPALAVQAATMGVVPYKLTQVVLQLCLALAESANDLRLMENGEKVALIKSGDTWAMSPKGALNTAKKLASDAVTGVVKEGEKKVKGVVNKLIDSGAEKVNIAVSDFTNDMTIAISDQVTQLVGSAFSVFEEELVSVLDTALKAGKSAAGDAASVADSVISTADGKAKEIINGCNEKIKPIVKEFYDSYIGGKLTDFKSKIKKGLESIDSLDAGQILLDVQKNISTTINDSIIQLQDFVDEKAESLVNNLRDELNAKVGGTIEMGADKILEVTNGYLDSTFDSLSEKMPDMAGKASNSSSLASIIKFNYGDYLQIFLFLKLCVNDTAVMSRIADVIQLNINNALTETKYTHPVKGKFLMSNAYTYVQIEADVKLKTMFISLPFFTEYAGNGASYFNLKYKSVLGY